MQFRLDEPERRNHEEYQEREIQPRHDRLTLGAGIFLGIAGLIIVLRALASTQRWWSARAPLDLSNGWRRFVPRGFGAGIRDTVLSRKLHRIESDFQALKSLRDNGVISQEVFEQRTSALRDALATD